MAGVSRSDPDFEDAQNQALLEIWKSFPQHRQGASVCAWMLTVARGATSARIVRPKINSRNRTNRLRSLSRPESHVDVGETVAGQDSLTHLLNALSPPHREVLLLRYLEGLSESEVAERLGTNVKTISSRTRRAKQAAIVVLNRIEAQQ